MMVAYFLRQTDAKTLWKNAKKCLCYHGYKMLIFVHKIGYNSVCIGDTPRIVVPTWGEEGFWVGQFRGVVQIYSRTKIKRKCSPRCCYCCCCWVAYFFDHPIDDFMHTTMVYAAKIVNIFSPAFNGTQLPLLPKMANRLKLLK